MSRSTRIGLVALVLVAVGAFALYAIGRRAQWARGAPAWLAGGQPPDGIASQLSTLTAAESWAANRCGPIAAPCAGHTAGRRVRRTYPGTLAESEHSLIRGFLRAEAN